MKTVAIVITGHVRTFADRVDSFKKNILNVLDANNFSYDIYLSTWNILGSRMLGDFDKTNSTEYIDKIKQMIPLYKINIEIFDRNIFDKYKSKNYKKFPGLCGVNTCPDAVSMWYMIYKGYTLIDKEYDVIVRLRPDLEYHDEISIFELEDSAKSENTIYIPESDGKYDCVKKGIMDHLCYGNYVSMLYYFDLFSKIPEYQQDNTCIHTGEGFLAKHFENNKNIQIKRTKWNYNIIY